MLDRLSSVSPSTALTSAFVVALVVVLQYVLSRPSSLLSLHPHLHLQRRLQHVVTGLVLVHLTSRTLPRSTSIPLLSLVLLLLLLLHRLRLAYPSLNSAFIRLTSTLLRPHEHSTLPSAFWLLLAFLASLCLTSLAPSLFPPSLSPLTLLYEAIGDPLAGLIGSLSPPFSPPRTKTWQGSLAMLTACTAITWAWGGTGGWLAWGPLVATAAERRGGRGVWDDNFIVPTLSLLAMSALHHAGALPPLPVWAVGG